MSGKKKNDAKERRPPASSHGIADITTMRW